MTSRGVLALGAAPLLAGAAVPWSLVDGDGIVCPFRALTGVPCPFCGATRAFVAFGHLDGRWLEFGAVWVVAALILVAAGVARRRVPLAAAPAAAVFAWAWALAHAGSIATGP